MSNSRDFNALDSLFNHGTVSLFAQEIEKFQNDDIQILEDYLKHLEMLELEPDAVEIDDKQTIVVKHIAAIYSADTSITMDRWIKALLYALTTREFVFIDDIWKSQPQWQPLFCFMTSERMPVCLKRFTSSLEANHLEICQMILIFNQAILTDYIFNKLDNSEKADIIEKILFLGSSELVDLFIQPSKENILFLEKCVENANKNGCYRENILIAEINIALFKQLNAKHRTLNIDISSINSWIRSLSNALHSGASKVVNDLWVNTSQEWRDYFFGRKATINGKDIQISSPLCLHYFECTLKTRGQRLADEFWGTSKSDILIPYILSRTPRIKLDLFKKIIRNASNELFDNFLDVMDDDVIKAGIPFIENSKDNLVRRRLPALMDKLAERNPIKTISQPVQEQKSFAEFKHNKRKLNNQGNRKKRLQMASKEIRTPPPRSLFKFPWEKNSLELFPCTEIPLLEGFVPSFNPAESDEPSTSFAGSVFSSTSTQSSPASIPNPNRLFNHHARTSVTSTSTDASQHSRGCSVR